MRSTIYIPLCFYFIDIASNIFSFSTVFTFHYASTLSYRRDSNTDYISVFTFHYASTLSCAPSRMSMLSTPFTFHYASTLSGVSGSDRGKFKGFTFHYASTLSAAISSAVRSVSNLHSTMLLLYRILFLRNPLEVRIYIPLCFYFI